MPVPVFSKTWAIAPNTIVASSGTAALDYRAALFAIKQLLLTPGLMTIAYSCNGVVAGVPGDNVDRWATAVDLVWGTGAGARSWVVLRSTGIGAGFQVLIACRFATASVPSERWIDVVVSPSSGFSGGSTTTNPTASDAIPLRDGTASSADVNGYWLSDAAATFSTTLHAWGASDGSQVRIVACTSTAAKPVAILAFGQLVNPPTGHSSPAFYATWWSAADATVAKTRYADLFENARVWGAHGGVAYALYLAAHEVYAGGALGEGQLTANDLTGNWPITPCALLAAKRGAPTGVMGEPPDLWWGSAGIAAEGTTMDQISNPRRLVQWGNLVLPWDGATVPHNGAASVAAAVNADPTLTLAPTGTRYVPLSDEV